MEKPKNVERKDIPLTESARHFKIKRIKRYKEIISAEKVEDVILLIVSFLIASLYLTGIQLEECPIEWNEVLSNLEREIKVLYENIKGVPWFDAACRILGGVSFFLSIADFALARMHERKKEDFEDEIEYDDGLRETLGLDDSEDFGKGM